MSDRREGFMGREKRRKRMRGIWHCAENTGEQWGLTGYFSGKHVQRSGFSVQRSAFSDQRSAFCVLRSAFCVLRSAFSFQRSVKAHPELALRVAQFCRLRAELGHPAAGWKNCQE